MAMKHVAVKLSGDKGFATEWNDDHVIDSNVPFEQYQAEELIIHKGAIFPTGAIEGQIFYRTDTDETYYYDGADWYFYIDEKKLSDAIPQDVSDLAGAAGTSEDVSRADHVHMRIGSGVRDMGQKGFGLSHVPSKVRTEIAGSIVTVTTEATDTVLIFYRCDGHVYGTTGGNADELWMWLYLDGAPDYLNAVYLTESATNDMWTTMSSHKCDVPGAGVHTYSIYVQSTNGREDISNGMITVIVLK